MASGPARRQLHAVKNCEVKASRQDGDQMEVILKISIKITASLRDLEASMFTTSEPEASEITLSVIRLVDNHTKVITDVKVLMVMEPIDVSGGRRKQYVRVADQTGTALWEEHVDSLKM